MRTSKMSAQLSFSERARNEAPGSKTLVVGVLGLGYVGLPLAIEFGKKMRTVGFDLSSSKVQTYSTSVDPTGEVAREEFLSATHLSFTTDPSELRACDVIVVAVPTPVDDAHLPDFSPLVSACRAIGP